MSASVIICFSAMYAWSRRLTLTPSGESGGSTAWAVVSMGSGASASLKCEWVLVVKPDNLDIR
jgi:hypothetical protein